MPDSHPLPTREQFDRWVHDALNRLYDSVYLRTHPLAEALADAEASTPLQRSEALRRALLGAIHSLQPKPGTPAESPDWRAYNILELRYIEGLSVGEVAGQLGLSQSQYFRDQARVLEAVTALLWERYERARSPEAPRAAAEGASRREAVRSEAERLSLGTQRQTLDLAELLTGLRPVLDRLAQARGVVLDFDLARPQVTVLADRVVLRQAVLSLATHALDLVAGGRIELGTFADERASGVCLRAWGATDEQAGTPETCAQLMAAMGGRLEVGSGPAGRWEARLAWPVEPPQVLLAIDDNAGLIELFRRCLAGHGWQVLGAASSAEARQMLASNRPTVIVMDIMMPEEDGWELLSALKADPELGSIPVIVCSVLNEPQVALTLGAAAFLPKPVTQTALLQALAPWQGTAASPAPEH